MGSRFQYEQWGYGSRLGKNTSSETVCCVSADANQGVIIHSCSVYRVSQEECARLRESVPYVKVYRYNTKHLYPKLNGYGDNGQRKVGASCSSKYRNLHSMMCHARALMTLRVECSVNRACVTFNCLHGSWKRHVKCLEP